MPRVYDPSPMADTPSRNRGARRVVAVTVGLLVAALAAELVLRATHWGVWGPRVDDYHILRRADASYWIFDPNEPTTHKWDGDPYGRLPPGATMTYALNSWGLRGAEPEAGRPKIFFVGDSFTFGEGVAVEDTFPVRVERALAGRMSPPPQSINAGVPGYGSREEAERLPGWLGDFKPRVVVLVYIPNDPIPLDQSFSRGDDLLMWGRANPSPFYLVRLLSSVLHRTESDRATEDWYLSYYYGERRENWERTRKELAEMKAASEKAGARFGVAYFPLLHRLKDGPFAKIEETVAERCREIGAPFLDLTPSLAREPEQSLWVHPADHHPDARANEIAAEALAPFVAELLR